MADGRSKRVAIIAGVGPRLGAALVRKLASEECSIGMLARSPEFIGKLATEMAGTRWQFPQTFLIQNKSRLRFAKYGNSSVRSKS